MAETGHSESQRCSLGSVRYAVAFLVSVVAVLVVAKTLSTVLHQQQLKLVINEGYVEVERFPVLPPPGNLTLGFGAVAYNPTAYDITYREIKVQFLDVASSPPTDVYSFDVSYIIRLESLAWEIEVFWDTLVPRLNKMPLRYLTKIYDGGFIQVAMRVRGTLTKSPQSPAKPNSTSSVVYYCWPVVLGFYDDISRNDVSCQQPAEH